MPYLNNLNWLKELGRFDSDQQKVLLGLSHSKRRWRTRDRLSEVTGLPTAILDDVLTGLIKADLIRPSFSKNKEIIFGLRERVD